MPILSAPRVIASGRLLAPGAVVVEDGRVAAVLDERPPPGPGHLALDHGVLAPGLIDVQLNGAFGVDLVDAGPEEWDRVVCRLPSTGVTGFLATFISAPIDDLIAAMARASTARAACQRRPGARILGVHLEGPFLSPRRRGAHDAAHLIDPTADQVDRLLEAGAGILELLTLAAEREGALEASKRLAGAGCWCPSATRTRSQSRSPRRSTRARAWSPTSSTPSAACTTASRGWRARRSATTAWPLA